MKALSIRQPHASLLLIGPKRYETRGWRLPQALAGKRTAIHAAKSDSDLLEIAEYIAERRDGGPADETMDAYIRAIRAAGFENLSAMPRGCVIGSVVFPTCVEAQHASDHHNMGDFSAGRFAWLAAEPRLLREPVPFRGKLGFFNVPDDLLLETPMVSADDAI